MWYVYLIRCRDHSLYTGITTNLVERLRRHNTARGSRYVSGRAPAVLVYVEPHPNQSAARRRELEVQSWGRKKKLSLVSASRPE